MLSEHEYDFDGNAHGPDVTFFGAAKKALMDLRKRMQRFWIISSDSHEVYAYSERGNYILREDAELSTELLPNCLLAPAARATS